ncbi:MAG: kinase [Elusimicrobia bacterium]|nr:kinase [Elusimicrobiota bacterium]
MIISRTPFRMSFFGGGTDYPAWYREHGGAVVSTAIDKYCYITCRYLPPFFDYRSRILYSKVETVTENSKIEHPAVRAALEQLKITGGVEIHHDGDLPARTGLGSSSSFAVGLLHALYAMQNKMLDKLELAREAIRIEQDVLKENVGCQDQVIAAVGGFQKIDFLQNGEIRANPVTIGREKLDGLQDHILLYFTGFSRIASTIVKEQLEKMPDRKAELSRMREMVDESLKLLSAGDLARFGRLLDESWKLKRSLSSKISTPAIDEMYEAAKSAGALGGKLLGAGGGGFMIVFARPEEQPKVKERLKKLLRIPFRFEGEGSHILLYQPEALPEPR